MDILFFIMIIFMVLPAWGLAALKSRRSTIIGRLEQQRKSRVIVLIHRQEVMSLLGFPVARYINIEDSERILRAIHMTPADMPIDLIVHTPGGLVLAAQQIALALTRHQAKVTVFVPHYAMSGGTMIALAADEIVMDENAVLGPIDPQLGNTSAVDLIKLSESKPAEKLDDETVILIDIARKSLRQVQNLLEKILLDHVPAVKVAPQAIPRIADSLISGKWTHDHPVTFEDAKELGLPVQGELPNSIFDLMDLYPQAQKSESAVQYIPLPYKVVPAHEPSSPA
jgi:ClpP class serine protease